MKKPYFFLLHALIIVFMTASLSSAQVKTSNSATTVKAGSIKAIVPAQNQNKPAPATITAPVKQTSAAVAVNVTAQKPMNPASSVPSAQPQHSAASTAVNVTPVATTSAAAPASLPALNPAAPYSYNPLGKPDPFRPFVVIEKPKPKAAADVKKAPESIFPLQRAETNNYTVVGIIGSEDHRMAIAQDSGKKFYPLLIGTRIGLRNGKVVEILADRVIVQEYENNKAKKVILKLRKN